VVGVCRPAIRAKAIGMEALPNMGLLGSGITIRPFDPRMTVKVARKAERLL
jgi:hypothetical protein